MKLCESIETENIALKANAELTRQLDEGKPDHEIKKSMEKIWLKV